MSSLVEAEEEIKDLKRKLRESDYKLDQALGDMQNARKDVWELRQKMSSSEDEITKQIGVLNEQQTQTDDKLDQALNDVKNAKENVEELSKKVSSSEKDISKEIAALNEQQTQTTKASQILTTRVHTAEGIAGNWPKGHYCILASGACPANFTRHSAYLKAIKTYAGNTNYVGPGKFG